MLRLIDPRYIGLLTGSPKTIPASSLIGLSYDILPLILNSVRDLLEADAEGRSWKKSFLPLLLVNKCFFHCGADVLWNTMDSVAHVFKLLPWFKSPYSGIGTYKYCGADDWERFMVYASRIKSFSLDPSPNVDISFPWVMELHTLPGRPDPFFPALQQVDLCIRENTGGPLLFLLVGASLRSLCIDAKRSPTEENILAVLPRLSSASPNLCIFKYHGTYSDAFVTQICALQGITSLRLSFETGGDANCLRQLRNLPHLRLLKLSAPWLDAFTPGQPITKQSQPLTTNSGQLLPLLEVYVETTEHQQCAIARILSPGTLMRLLLSFMNLADLMPFYLCLGLYLKANPSLRELVVVFNESWEFSLPGVPRSHRAAWPSFRDASDAFFSELQASRTIRAFTVKDMPYRIAASIYLNLLHASSAMTHLHHLSISVKLPASLDGPDFPPIPTFPGLSFLATTIWRLCPNLKSLSMHFDENLVLAEDLSKLLHPFPATSRHKLQTLVVNTGTTAATSRSLHLPYGRIDEITSYLMNLFPRLGSIRGSTKEPWEEVEKSMKQIRRRGAELFAHALHIIAMA
ncbi:hypothetical protein NMY22_g3576 [Coprinellus aureogranulatus]|nr:hypothetical protein NMY22_g3576 [Coprinellus aureogranulatus]